LEDKMKGFWFPNLKSGEVCWGQLEGQFGCHIIQYKAQDSTGPKAGGQTAFVFQQGFGDPCGGDVVDGTRYKTRLGTNIFKQLGGGRSAEIRSPDSNRDRRKTHDLEITH
jgi:hypothetical protein